MEKTYTEWHKWERRQYGNTERTIYTDTNILFGVFIEPGVDTHYWYVEWEDAHEAKGLKPLSYYNEPIKGIKVVYGITYAWIDAEKMTPVCFAKCSPVALSRRDESKT